VFEPGLPIMGQRFWSGQVGSGVSVTDAVSDPVFVVFARVLLSHLRENTPPWNPWDSVYTLCCFLHRLCLLALQISNLLLTGYVGNFCDLCMCAAQTTRLLSESIH